MPIQVKQGSTFKVSQRPITPGVCEDLLIVRVFCPPPPEPTTTPPYDPCQGIQLVTQNIFCRWQRAEGRFDHFSSALGMIEPLSPTSSSVTFYQELCHANEDEYRIYLDGEGVVNFSGVDKRDVRWDGSILSTSGALTGETRTVRFYNDPPPVISITVQSGDSVSEVSLKEQCGTGDNIYQEVLHNPKFDCTREELLLMEEFPTGIKHEDIGWGEGFNEYIIYPIRN